MANNDFDKIILQLSDLIRQRDLLQSRIDELSEKFNLTTNRKVEVPSVDTEISNSVFMQAGTVRDILKELFHEKKRLSIDSAKKELAKRYAGPLTNRTASRAMQALKKQGVIKSVGKAMYELVE